MLKTARVPITTKRNGRSDFERGILNLPDWDIIFSNALRNNVRVTYQYVRVDGLVTKNFNVFV